MLNTEVVLVGPRGSHVVILQKLYSIFFYEKSSAAFIELRGRRLVSVTDGLGDVLKKNRSSMYTVQSVTG
jgi:hypothetical protein